MLKHFGAEIASAKEGSHGRRIALTGQPELHGAEVVVPADPSSAAFPIVAALIVEGSDIVLSDVMTNPLRTGLFTTLREMGASIEESEVRGDAGEPMAQLRVRASKLRGVEVPPERAPSMIDEYLVLAVAAAFAEGTTIMRGLQELRVKESDRLEATAAMLRVNGVKVEISGDDLIVEGRGHVPGGGLVATHMDHRIAMSALVMGLARRQAGEGRRHRLHRHQLSGFHSDDALARRGVFMIIAIDGPAASGKGTLGKRLAHHYGYRHLDTGVIYRAVAKALLDAGADLTDEARAVAAALELDPEKFGNPALKTQRMGEAASVVSAIPRVREALVNFQRQFAADPPGAVLDGRDIGTVICPHADVKIFVVADPKVRARRRTLEARARGEEADEAAVLADILKRDERDQNRAVAPLKAAADAHLLDNSQSGYRRRRPGRHRHCRGRPSGPAAGFERVLSRAGSGFEPLPSLEESPLQVLKSISRGSIESRVQAPDQIQRIERAGMLPARFCDLPQAAVVRVCGPLTLHARYALNPNGRRYPHLENKWLRLLLPIILPATISPRCSTSPLPAAICRKAPSSRARWLRLKRTWPSSTSA